MDKKGAKKVLSHRYCQLCLENGCHTFVCRLFQVINHISAALYVHELTRTCPPKMCDWQNVFRA